MIDSGIYTRSTVFLNPNQIQSEQIIFDDTSSTVNKASMYHLVSAHIYQIYVDQKIEATLKQKLIYEFGFKLGFNIAEQQCLGFVKYCYAKPDPKGKTDTKQFVGQMKVLNGRIWNILVGNKAKLFAINNQNVKGVYYKIQDKQFSLGKSVKKPSNHQQKQYRKLLLEYCQGFVKGSLDKFDLDGEIICGQGAEGSVYAELKGLFRKNSINNYNQYSKKVIKDNNFLQ